MSNPTPEEIEGLIERLREEPDTMAWPTIRRRMRDAAEALAALRARADAPAGRVEPDWKALAIQHCTQSDEKTATIRELRSKLEAVVKAGEPFEKAAWLMLADFYGPVLGNYNLTYEDFRALSAAIAAAKGEGEAK